MSQIFKNSISAVPIYFNNLMVIFVSIVYGFYHVQVVMRNTVLSIYLIDHLKIDASTIAWFPVISSLSLLW